MDEARWVRRLHLVAGSLFLLQVFHLLWLTWYIITGDLLIFPGWFNVLLDYTEIPAIIGLTAAYVVDLTSRSGLYVALLNSQWIHIFWITDEFITKTGQFTGVTAVIAIGIDYLEIPVMVDTIRKACSGKRPPRSIPQEQQ